MAVTSRGVGALPLGAKAPWRGSGSVRCSDPMLLPTISTFLPAP
jgi:hypothetical protein